MPKPAPSFLPSCLRSELGRFMSGLADPAYLGLVGLGLAAWLLPQPAAALSPGVLLLKAGAEEAVFRAGLQGALAGFLPARLGPLTLANLLASAAFALVHLVSHPPLWAGLVFLPSLCFGLAWDRHRSLLLCVLLHFLYNLLLFYRP